VLRVRKEERREARLLIDVWSTDSFNFIRTIIVVPWSAPDWLPISNNALTSCKENNCLYVSVWSGVVWDEYSVCKVDLMSDNKQVKWRVDGMPSGLSINKKCNVIVTCCYDDNDAIEEYTPSGSQSSRTTAIRSE